MTTINENAWNEQDSLQNKPGYQYENDNTLNSAGTTPDPDDDDDLDDKDLDDDDLDLDDEDFDDDDLDDDYDDLDEDEDANERVGGTTASGLSSGVTSSYDGEDNEIPEQQEADTEKEGYESGTEIEQQDKGDEASYSERNDVTPPTPHEFPSTGTHTETDFASRPQGRTTGRMVGHEPGTEGI